MIEVFNEAMTKRRKGKNNDDIVICVTSPKRTMLSIVERVKEMCRGFTRGMQELKSFSTDVPLPAPETHTCEEQRASDTSFPGSAAWNDLTAVTFADKYDKMEIIKK